MVKVIASASVLGSFHAINLEPEVLRTGKTHAQRAVDRGQGAPRPTFSCLPLLTTYAVGGGCGSFRVGRCVSGPLWGVCISTPDQTPGRRTNHFRERGKEVLGSPCITVWESPGKSRERILVLGAQINRKENSACSLALGDPSSATHPGPGQTLERAELTCRVTWSTLSADGSRMLTMPRSVSTKI